jgi:hypothetical protein
VGSIQGFSWRPNILGLNSGSEHRYRHRYRTTLSFSIPLHSYLCQEDSYRVLKILKMLKRNGYSADTTTARIGLWEEEITKAVNRDLADWV